MLTLVLLDLKLPKVLGLDVLKWVCAPTAAYGRQAAEALRADAYFVKPNVLTTGSRWSMR